MVRRARPAGERGVRQTETGIATFCRAGSPPGHVGLPLNAVEVKLGAQDEILVRSAGNFSGYLNMPGTTTATLVGLAGCTPATSAPSLPGGELKITDRLKDIIITAGGKGITPSLLENRLEVLALHLRRRRRRRPAQVPLLPDHDRP